jgi:hypothetical protein
MRRPVLLPFLLPFLALAACGQAVPVGNSTVADEDTPDTVTPAPVAVRVGELGPNFQACSAAGSTRHLGAGETLPVRSAPFDNAPQTGAVAGGARFFICTRSLDQKWFGIVYDPAGALADRCAVADPVASPRAYGGPCASGWVSTPFVKMIAGNEPAPAEAESNRAEPLLPAAKGG